MSNYLPDGSFTFTRLPPGTPNPNSNGEYLNPGGNGNSNNYYINPYYQNTGGNTQYGNGCINTGGNQQEGFQQGRMQQGGNQWGRRW